MRKSERIILDDGTNADLCVNLLCTFVYAGINVRFPCTPSQGC